MSRSDAVRVLCDQGASVVASLEHKPTLVLVGDETTDWRRLLPDGDDAQSPTGLAEQQFEIVEESDLWSRLGLIGYEEERLYTPAMLAELVGVRVEVVRRWVRRGYLKPSREVGRLVYLGIREVHAARILADLLAAGCSLTRIDKLVAELTEVASDIDRPLVELAVVVQGRQIYFRRGDDLAEPSGQLLLDFEPESALSATADTIAFDPLGFPEQDGASESEALSVEAARALSQDLSADGDTAGAIQACRAALFAGGDADDHFALAELLYQRGDLAAARERYYAAIEIDEDFIEARTSLGCVLAELGDRDLSLAAFEGVLAQQPDFADALYHAARVLDELGRLAEAEIKWRRFLGVSPTGPWTEEARARLDAAEGDSPG